MSVSAALGTAQALHGWDWSRLRDRMAPLGWSYPELLAEAVSHSTRALDVGTGGGEVFSAVARPDDVAVDFSTSMTDAARQALCCPLVRANHAALPLRESSFDLVADRHVAARPAEVLRVVRPGGVYLTQQVGANICQNIFDALGWGSNGEFWRREAAEGGFEYWDAELMADYYQAAGCRILRREEAYVDYEFLDTESLAFWLANAPLPEIDLVAQREALDSLPLKTNWHAQLLMIETPRDTA